MTKNNLPWQQAIPGASIRFNQVQVWRVSLNISERQRAGMLGMLSADEVARAGRFYFEKDRNRFIAARGMLRKILGLYLGENPHRIRFAYTPKGKPVLGTDFGCDALRFNLSHAGSYALYGFTRGRNVGIDLECIRYDIAVDPIVQRFFSPGEIRSLAGIKGEKRQEEFFRYWTRKEALLKAMGEGLAFPMEQCNVSLISGKLFSPVTLPGEKRETPYWYVQDVFPGNGYAAAIAIEGGDCDLSCMNYAL
jgi:4'-phosphopantetheinyl transferase